MPDIGIAGGLDLPVLVAAPAGNALARRGVMLAAIAAGLVGGWWLTDHAAVAAAEPEYVRLMRGMAGIKAMAGLGVVAALWWRLKAAVGPVRLAAYALGCAAMAAGPVLIWDIGWIKLGALLLHAGLFGTVVVLWRDPAMGPLLEAAMRRRKTSFL
jgi:hypothetical protein